jgi:hypothetical protein
MALRLLAYTVMSCEPYYDIAGPPGIPENTLKEVRRIKKFVKQQPHWLKDKKINQ